MSTDPQFCAGVDQLATVLHLGTEAATTSRARSGWWQGSAADRHLVANLNDYVLSWRNGELYVEPFTPAVETGAPTLDQVKTDERLAA
jgi:hypothetical protein